MPCMPMIAGPWDAGQPGSQHLAADRLLTSDSCSMCYRAVALDSLPGTVNIQCLLGIRLILEGDMNGVRRNLNYIEDAPDMSSF